MIQKLRNFRNYFNFSENKGMAQIPLLLGLLLMAVAVPVATQLVKQNQDTRNKAAGTSVCYPSNGTTICYYPTSAPATAVPTATPTVIPGSAYCSASTNAICPGKCIANVNGGTCPTTTSSLPSPSPAGSIYCCDQYGACAYKAVAICPVGSYASTPTPRQCSQTTYPTTSCVISGTSYGWSCNGSTGGWECKVTAFVPTATKVPTLTPTLKQCSQTTYPTTSCVIGNTIYGWSCNGTTGGWECKATTPVATVTPYKPFCPGYCSSNGLCNLGDASNNVAYSCGSNSISTCCIPKTTPTPRQCSQTTYPTTSCVIGNTIYGWSCNTTTLGWECKATTPVATVTKVPSPIPTNMQCSASNSGSRCVNGFFQVCNCPLFGSCYYTQTNTVCPTSTPTPRQCSQTTYPTTSCVIGNTIYGWSCNITTLGWECKATTPVATVTPVNLCGGIASVCSGKKIGDSCNIFGTCHAGTAGVISDCNCKLGAVPTNTPTMTPKPTAYSTPIAMPTCYCGFIGGKYIYTGNCSQTVDGTSCNSPTPVRPTATPSVKLASSPTPMPGVTGICRYSCTAEGRLPSNICSPSCVAPLLCCGAPIPTSGPTDACAGINQYCTGDKAYVCNLARTGFSSQPCATGYSCDSSGFRCVPDGSGTSTPTPTRVPTATPTTIRPTATPTSGGICLCVLGIGCCPSATPRPTSGGGSNPTDVPATPTSVTKPSITMPPSMCTMCPNDFKCYVNNGDYKWFSSYFQGNGYVLATGAEVTNCGGVVKPPFLNKTKGDANCDGTVDIDDRSLWTKEYTTDRGAETMSKVWLSDFDCDSKVTIYDRSIWTQNFIQLNSSSAN